MSADEVVRALREHAEWAQANEWECPITLGDVLMEAADLIESLQIMLQQKTDDYDDLETQMAELRLEYDKLNDFEQSQCAMLLDKLTASQRRERAAVEEIYSIAACDACKHYDPDENDCAKPMADAHKCFEWRGDVAEEGEKK